MTSVIVDNIRMDLAMRSVAEDVPGPSWSPVRAHRESRSEDRAQHPDHAGADDRGQTTGYAGDAVYREETVFGVIRFEVPLWRMNHIP